MLLRLLLRLNNLKLNNLNPLRLNPLRSTGAIVVAIATVMVGAAGAGATSIDGWNYDPASGQLKFEVADGVKPRHFLMAQPARIVVDLQDTQVGNALVETAYASGPVKKITVDQLQPGLVRVTLFMAADAVFLKGQVAIDRVGDGLRGTSDVWSVRPLLAGMSEPATGAAPGNAIVPVIPTAPVIPVIPPVSPISGETSLPGRFNRSSEPAVVPTVGELPPGMASVVLSARVKPSETKPAEIKIPAKPVSEVIPIAVPQLVLTKPVDIKPVGIKPAVTKLETAEIIATRPSEQLQTTPAVLDVPAMAMPPIRVPSLEMGLPKGERPKVQGNPSSVVSAMPIPDGIPAIAPGVGSGSPTVSVPPLGSLWVTPAAVPSVIPSALPSAMPNAIPSVMPGAIPAAMPNVLPAVTPNFGVMPLPDRVPSVVPTVQRVSPVQSSIPSVSPVIQPQTQVVQTQVVQTENYRPSGSGVQPVERQAIANSPASVVPGLIQFGQPLSEISGGGVRSLPPEMAPGLGNGVTSGVTPSVNNGLMLPIGTVLKVRYTGISSLAVKNGEARQEMLVLQTTIRDRSGLVIAPEGTTIYGRFEGGGMNNRFVASAIAIQGQMVALVAESGDLGGSRNPKQGSVLQNSGIGALAGIIIGGLTGGNAIGGAAAGAAITYATTPKVTAVQPGQVLEIRLTQDWVLPGGVAMDDRSVGPISRGF